MRYPVHPVAELFPLIEGDELDALVEDIRANGLLHPVLVRQGVLLDGRNRVRACETAGVPVIEVEFYGDERAAERRIISENVKRRHLSTSQRALLAAQFANLPQGRPSEKGQDCPFVPVTVHEAAEDFGVSDRSVKMANALLDLTDDTDELVASTAQAAVAAIAKGEKKAETLNKGLTEAKGVKRKHTTAAQIAGLPDIGAGRLRLLHGDFRERLASLPDESVDLIITDPPYPKEDLPMWSDLGALAKRLLGPRGILFAYSGQLWLPEVLNRLLDTGLHYGWTFCLDLPGSYSRVPGRNMLQAWKPILAFTPGPWPSSEWGDDKLLSPKPNKSEYEWAQNPEPMRHLIRRYAAPDALILDPFLGVGSFGFAAQQEGRRFIGVELDAKRFEAARKNLEGLAWE